MSSLSVKAKLDVFGRLERLWADERFNNGHSTPDVRAFIETYWWAKLANPDAWWAEMHRLAGRERGDYWARSIYREDAPRWEPDEERRFGCDVMLPIAKRPCGRSGASERVTDPETGQWRMLTRCGKHGGWNAPEFLAERLLDKTRIPKPHPNRGGMLPSYIRANNWPDLYAVARLQWEPPAVGIVADDWPVMERVIGEPLPRLTKADLRLIPGGAA